MKVKSSELAGRALDWAVGKCEGIESRNNWVVHFVLESDMGVDLTFECQADTTKHAGEQCLKVQPDALCLWFQPKPAYSPTSDWAKAGPIIEREGLTLTHQKDRWSAQTDDDVFAYGPTPLVAAMRLVVLVKLGEEVDVPEVLQ